MINIVPTKQVYRPARTRNSLFKMTRLLISICLALIICQYTTTCNPAKLEAEKTLSAPEEESGPQGRIFGLEKFGIRIPFLDKDPPKPDAAAKPGKGGKAGKAEAEPEPPQEDRGSEYK